jgi:hypothetical protein
MGRRSSSAPRAVSDATQTFEVKPRGLVGDADQEVACPLLRLTVPIECGGAANGERMNDLGGWCAGSEDAPRARDGSVELWITWNLDAGVSTRHDR